MSATSRSSLARGGVLLGVAAGLSNALGYALTIVFTRSFTPAEYGALGALLGVALIGGIPAGGLQYVLARRTATRDLGPGVNERAGLLLSLAVGGVLTGVTILLSPVAAALLHLDSAWPAVWLGTMLLPWVLTGALLGGLLGHEQYGRFAVGQVVAAAGRFVAGVVTALLGLSVAGAMGTLAAGTLLAALVVWLLSGPASWRVPTGTPAEPDLSPPDVSAPDVSAPDPSRLDGAPNGSRPGVSAPDVSAPDVSAPDVSAPDVSAPDRSGPDPNEPAGGAGARRLLPDLWRASSAIAGVIVLSNVDLLLARHFLSRDDSGEYALASLFAKACLWGAQFVPALVFPRLARDGAGRTLLLRAALAAAGVGVAGILLAAVAGGPIVRLVAGDDTGYAGTVALAVPFAVLGTLWALVQLALLAAVAAGDPRPNRLLWALVAVEVLVITVGPHETAGQLLATCLVTAVLLLAGAVLLDLRSRRSSPPPTPAAPVATPLDPAALP